MNCPLDKSATAAKPWRSQPFGVALDIDQAPCVRRDPHLSHRRAPWYRAPRRIFN